MSIQSGDHHVLESTNIAAFLSAPESTRHYQATVNPGVYSATVVNTLSGRRTTKVIPTAGTHDVVGLGVVGSSMFAATTNDRLFARSLSPGAAWSDIGHAQQITAIDGLTGFASLGNKLFATTSGNTIWMRDPVLHDAPWVNIGHADGVVGLAAANERLWAATSDNKLWYRDAVPFDVPWTHVGSAEGVVAMTANAGYLYVVTFADTLWARPATTAAASWTYIGRAQSVTGLAAHAGKLYVTTNLRHLWARDAVHFEVPFEYVGPSP